ncbi:MAG: hypothetical protein ABI231_11690, partial [Candidatus Tumulicola sp.]
MYRLHVACFLAAALIALSTASSAAARPSAAATLTTALQNALDTYVSTRAKPEHISAASLSISLKGASQNINLAA